MNAEKLTTLKAALHTWIDSLKEDEVEMHINLVENGVSLLNRLDKSDCKTAVIGYVLTLDVAQNIAVKGLMDEAKLPHNVLGDQLRPILN